MIQVSIFIVYFPDVRLSRKKQNTGGMIGVRYINGLIKEEF
jgi:hypothetical protein